MTKAAKDGRYGLLPCMSGAFAAGLLIGVFLFS
jgi:hypothetical protein